MAAIAIYSDFRAQEKEISHYFHLQNYKVLQGIQVTTGEYHTKEEALAVIEECRQRFLEQ